MLITVGIHVRTYSPLLNNLKSRKLLRMPFAKIPYTIMLLTIHKEQNDVPPVRVDKNAKVSRRSNNHEQSMHFLAQMED